ncbi:MAG: hypothetical protein OHK0039_23290 [Bacteroidia bacterium]
MYKRLLLLCCLVGIVSLQADPVEVVRRIDKSYTVDPQTVLEIRNRQGRVEVETWDRAEVFIEIEVIARGATEEQAQQRLGQVDIRERTYGDKIQWETRINSQQGLSVSNKDFEIRYALHLPSTHPLEIENRGGDVVLGRREANVDLDLRNSKLTIDRLEGQGNRLRLYMGDAQIGYFAGGDIDVTLGGLSIPEAGDTYLKTSTARVRLGRVEALELYASLGDIEIDSIGNFVGEINASDCYVGRLAGTASLDLRYAPPFEIGEVLPGAGPLDLVGTATGFRIALGADTPLLLDAEVEHTDFDATGEGIVVEESEDRPLRTYRSSTDAVARGATPVEVNIRNRYGSVKIWRK